MSENGKMLPGRVLPDGRIYVGDAHGRSYFVIAGPVFLSVGEAVRAVARGWHVIGHTQDAGALLCRR